MAAYTTIDDPEAHFQVQLYTGTGSSHAITLDGDTDMQPDMVWWKERASTDYHTISDSVRGATKRLWPNVTDLEDTQAESLKSFDSDGFTMGTNSGANQSSQTYVAWCWKAGTTSGITTTGSTITPIGYSFNQTSGFSIVRYHGNETAGAKVPHGLNAVPLLMILKNMNNAEEWVVYHHKNTAAPETDHLHLNGTDATADDNTIWNDTVPDTVNFTIGSDDITNKNGEDLIAYIFSEKQGFSKFGSYTGNGNVDGTFVYTGFRPAFLMIKQYDAAGTDWVILDNKRPAENPADQWIAPNTSAAEVANNTTPNSADLLSNGFKLRGSASDGANGNSDDFIYAAFAEVPFVNSGGVPGNAR